MAPECPQDNGQHFITAYRLLVSAPFYLLVSFLAVSHFIPWAVITWEVFSASGRLHSLTPGPWLVLFPFFLHPLSAYLAASHIFFFISGSRACPLGNSAGLAALLLPDHQPFIKHKLS